MHHSFRADGLEHSEYWRTSESPMQTSMWLPGVLFARGSKAQPPRPRPLPAARHLISSASRRSSRAGSRAAADGEREPAAQLGKVERRVHVCAPVGQRRT